MSEKKSKWEDAIGSLFDASAYKAADIVAPAPQGADLRLPELLAESRGPGNPYVGGSVPLGDFNVEGGYQRRNAMSPAEWRATLGYRRSF